MNRVWWIEKRDWPWNRTHGQNQSIVVNVGGQMVRIAVCEVIEAAGRQFVEAHVRVCKRELRGWRIREEG